MARVDRQQSRGPEELLNLACSLVDYATFTAYGRGKNMASLQARLEQLAHRLWSQCEIYKGHTHWRVTTGGRDELGNLRTQESFYIDFAVEPCVPHTLICHGGTL